MKKSVAIQFFLLAFICVLPAKGLMAQDKLFLWPEDELPNSRSLAIEDSVQNQRIYRIKYPYMLSFFPSEDDNNGSAVVIFPGGGYHHVTYYLSGIQLARWFNVMGMSAFVVNYRLPLSEDLVRREIAPIQDAQRAMKIIRAHAAEWGIDSDKIGVMGTSAGGHLAASLATIKEDFASAGDNPDGYSFEPDFMILVSPVITMGEYAHEGSRLNLLGKNPSDEMKEMFSPEKNITDQTPPAFIVHASDDEAVSPKNSILLYDALHEQGVAASLHIFSQGGHSIELRNNPGSTNLWTALSESWLKESGFLPKTN